MDTSEATAFLHSSMPLCTSGGLLHGGAVMALADGAGATCAFFNLPEGAGTSTIESKTNFVGAVRAGTVRRRPAPSTSVSRG